MKNFCLFQITDISILLLLRVCLYDIYLLSLKYSVCDDHLIISIYLQ